MQNVTNNIIEIREKTLEELEKIAQKMSEIILSSLVKRNNYYKFTSVDAVLDYIDGFEFGVSASVWDKIREDERYSNMMELLEKQNGK